ncbi:MAG: catalase [Pseudomonadota bacterium]
MTIRTKRSPQARHPTASAAGPDGPATAPLTTNQGVPIADNQTSLKAGPQGPLLLEDFILREKLTHFDHERIPERVVHARGSAAHGYFECEADLRALTRAAPFAGAGKRTPVFVRFSTVAGERGSSDTVRDVRGFAVKFYTEEGNWDLVGNNMPVFFIQDAMKFPDLVHAVRPEPHHGMPQASSAHDTFWDFVSLMPESTHMLCWLMSDRAIPRSYRMMQGFGVHTFRLVNAAGEARMCKFHWTPRAGVHSLVWDEAVKLAGADPDFHRRDLWEAIEAGCFPEWELGLQVFSDAEAADWPFDVLDPTKLIPEELCPLRRVGRLVLHRNPDNFFAETEQVAFCTAHVVPGIDFSEDPLLAGRHHSYLDTQLSRLGGPNFHELPVNAPRLPPVNNQRDGIQRQMVPQGRVAYEPNSLAGGCPFQAGGAGFATWPAPLPDARKLREKPARFAEHHAQARLFLASLDPAEQAHVEEAFRFELARVTVPAIRARVVARLRHVDDGMARRLAAALGMDLPQPAEGDAAGAPDYPHSPRLSQTAYPGDGSVATRKVAILVADGVEGRALPGLAKTLAAAGAVPRVVAPRLGSISLAGKRSLVADASADASPPVLFDAVLLPADPVSLGVLAGLAWVRDFVREHHRHGKTLGLLAGEGQDPALLLGRLGIAPAAALAGVALLGPGDGDTFLRLLSRHRHPDREPPPG